MGAEIRLLSAETLRLRQSGEGSYVEFGTDGARVATRFCDGAIAQPWPEGGKWLALFKTYFPLEEDEIEACVIGSSRRMGLAVPQMVRSVREKAFYADLLAS